MAKVKKCPDGFDIHVNANEAKTLVAVFMKIGGYGNKYNDKPSKNRPTRRAHTEAILDQLSALGVKADAINELQSGGGLHFNEPLE